MVQLALVLLVDEHGYRACKREEKRDEMRGHQLQSLEWLSFVTSAHSALVVLLAFGAAHNPRQPGRRAGNLKVLVGRLDGSCSHRQVRKEKKQEKARAPRRLTVARREEIRQATNQTNQRKKQPSTVVFTSCIRRTQSSASGRTAAARSSPTPCR